MVNGTDLARWLKKSPQPSSVRYLTDGDEERTLEVGSSRSRWKDAAEALENLGATRIECLDKDGKVLRVVAGEDGERGGSPGKDSKELLGVASLVREQGVAIERAYMAGADAASRGQEHLVQVVNILTAQWSATMNALQGVSMNLAKLARQQGEGGEEDDGMSQQMQQLLGIAAMKLMGGAGMMPGGENGTPKKEK